MARRATTAYRFTDPLGAARGDSARPPAWLAQRALMALYAVGALTLGLTLLLPDSDPSDHRGLELVGLACLLVAVILRGWRGPPAWLLLACFPLGTVVISVLVAVARPVALIPVYYIWPLILSAYFLQRREIIVNYALVMVGFGGALAGWARPDAPAIQWVSIAIVGAVLVVLVVALKEGLAVAMQNLRLLATRDPLTDALNRRAFSEELDAAVARASRGEDSCAIAILDIDHFKTINDRFGHAEGDLALQRLVATIAERMRRGDVLGRLGGEEFAVLLHGTDARGAEIFGDDLRAAVGRPVSEGGAGFTISIGVAELGDGGSADAQGLLLAADRALYAAKDGGRDRVARAPSPQTA